MGIVYFVFATTVSLTINPWRINRTPLNIKALDPWREITDNLRLGKAALVNQGDWQAVILGSSRMEIAMDPTHPAFQGAKTLNLAMAAANIHETAPAANYALDRNPGIRTMVFGIDAGDFHGDFDSRKFIKSEDSPLSGNGVSVECAINQWIGGRSVIDSIATVQRAIAKRHPDRNPLGQWLKPSDPSNLRQYIEKFFNGRLEQTAEKWEFRPQVLRQDKAKLFTDLMTRARRMGVEVYVVIPAQHALKQIHPTQDKPDRMCWETDIKGLTQLCHEVNRLDIQGPPIRLWSFITFNRYTTQAVPVPGAPSQRMPYWFDLSHAKPELGSACLNRIFANRLEGTVPEEDIWIDLLNTDWEDIRQSWIQGHADYCKAHPEDVAWLRGLMAHDQRKHESGKEDGNH